ncbi:E1-E2 ATPase/hydrolase [Plasmodium cynomolgi strain B]|uniref:E1-E2 ATPase/hydrolase n=1 Tax=Plasmodium cynomolgi (strain B) TaxID=1120755 RepID=K6UU09_PLACD|nr:E1-E2 ATPase/hydrolase [Plasmodium cynomolgi strain B]GAB65625.1 E1-E2 ATPase/hydrolase [Plasmodium cynomolgi strain B]
MAKSSLRLSNINSSVKSKITFLKIEELDGVEEVTFDENSASILFNDSIIDANRLVAIINSSKDMDGEFQEEDKIEKDSVVNEFVHRENVEDVNMFTFYPKGKHTKGKHHNSYAKNIIWGKNMDEGVNSRGLLDGDGYVTLANAHGVGEDVDGGDNDKNQGNGKISGHFGSGYEGSYCEEGYQEIYRKGVDDGVGDGVGGDAGDAGDAHEMQTDECPGERRTNVRDNTLNDTYNRRGGTNAREEERAANKAEVKDEHGRDEDPPHSENFGALQSVNQTKRRKQHVKKQGIEQSNLQSNRQCVRKDGCKRGETSEDKEAQLRKGDSLQSGRSRRGNIFQDYETYRGKKENIYICELRIYNMTCDNCGNKIISFLKDKNLIVDGNSFATDSKVKLKLNVSEGDSYQSSSGCNYQGSDNNSVKNFVNKIMNEIKESGFNNDLIDLYKDEDNHNKGILFDITLYVFREDVIKAYGLLKNMKGIKNVEYDVRHEYVYILYNPDVVGIRFILESLKKKKNIDAYYDEDKEKFFRSTRNNEMNNSRKLIELLCCFFLSIFIIVLNNYQMNMGSMNGFYSYGTYKNYVNMFNFLHFRNAKGDFLGKKFAHESSFQSNGGENNSFFGLFFTERYFPHGEEGQGMTTTDGNASPRVFTSDLGGNSIRGEFQEVAPSDGKKKRSPDEAHSNEVDSDEADSDEADSDEADSDEKEGKEEDDSSILYPEAIDARMAQGKEVGKEVDHLEEESSEAEHEEGLHAIAEKSGETNTKAKQTKERGQDRLFPSDKLQSKTYEENSVNGDEGAEDAVGKKVHSSKKIVPNSNFFKKASSNGKDIKKGSMTEIGEVDFLFDFRREDKQKKGVKGEKRAGTSNEVAASAEGVVLRKYPQPRGDSLAHFHARFSRGASAKGKTVNSGKEVKRGSSQEVNPKGEEEEQGCKMAKGKNPEGEPKGSTKEEELLKKESLFYENNLPSCMTNTWLSIYLDSKIFGNLSLRLFFIFLLSSIVYIYFGFHFVLNGYKNLKNGIINMNVLISISSSFSYFYSLLLLLFCLFFSVDLDGIPLYFDSSALLICIMKLGFEIENFLVSFTKKKIEDLYERSTKHVYILEKRNDKTEDPQLKKQLSNCTITSSQNGKDNGAPLSHSNSSENVNVSPSRNGDMSPVGSSALSDFCKNSSQFSSREFKVEEGRHGGAGDDAPNNRPTLFPNERKGIDINKIFCEDKKININDFTINSYPVQFIQKHDILVFYEGATLLIDGIKMNDDISYVDESMISGEKKPITKFKGDKIYAGSKCVQGIIILFIDDISKGNYIEYIKKTLDEVNCKKTNLQLYADKIASIFIPFIIGLCIVVFFIWFFLTYFDYVNIRKDNYFKLNRFLSCVFFSIHFSLSILCVACPCAVGLASPLSIAISSYICSSIGIILKNINIFEIFLECNHFIFDKTGTLTVGKPVVNKIYVSSNLELFTDQLLKSTSKNNLSVKFGEDDMGSALDYLSSDDHHFSNFHLHTSEEKNKRTQKSAPSPGDINGVSVYSRLGDTSDGGEHFGNLDKRGKNKGSLSHGSAAYVGDMPRKNEQRDRVSRKGDSWRPNESTLTEEHKNNCRENDTNDGGNNKTLNFIESIHCSGKNVTFYSFTTQRDYYKIEIKKSVMRREERNSPSNFNDTENIPCSGKKSIFNRIVSFINDKRRKNKYNQIGDHSLKEYFINNPEVSISSHDDSYTSETSSENNDTTITDTQQDEELPYGAELKKNDDDPFDSENNLSEKITNWLYLFLSLSSNLEKYSNHLYATSINTFINSNFCINETFDVQNLKNGKSQGITGVVKDLSVTIGTLYYCYTKYKNTHCRQAAESVDEKLNIKNLEAHLYSCDCNVHKTYQYLYNYSNSKKNESNNIIFMCIEGIIVGFFTLVDDIKPEVFDLIRYLKRERKKVYVCTGDNYVNALYISKILGISKKNVSSNTLPMEKVHFVKKIQSLDSGKVCMIGDGINDCFALKSADLGLSLSTRSNVVMDSADACIVDNDISVIMKLFEISRKTLMVIKFNFLFSFLINVFFILLASGSFYALNYVFSPFLFTFLMFCSSIIVILSSLSLKL